MLAQTMTSSTSGVGALLQERLYFEVPLHQRDYSWPIGAVEQYVADIVDAMTDGVSEYFIGLIVLIPSEEIQPAKRHQILDGQQRLATTTMMYSAIRKLLRDDGFDQDAEKIQSRFIGAEEIGSEVAEPRLILNSNNRGTFEEIVVKQCSDEDIAGLVEASGRFSSTRLLLEATAYCRRKIAELANQRGDKDARRKFLSELAMYLRDRVQTNCLLVTSAENAYTIFESLNDRGIDLSVLDLLKNHIFHAAGLTETIRVQADWTKMVTLLGDKDTDHFLKAFWTSRYGRVQKGRLFHELKKRHETKSQVLILLADLGKVADVYANLDIADSDLWKPHGDGAQESVGTLAMLGAIQTRPILLAAIERFDNAGVTKLLRYLVTLIVRYQLIGRGRTGRLETTSASVAEAIFARRIKTPAAAWEQLKSIVPPDEDFQLDFARYVEPKAQRARYILRSLEAQRWVAMNPGRARHTEPITDPQKITLEHVLPKNPDQSWSAVAAADKNWRELLDRVGNLCLLDKPANKKIGAGSYAAKSAAYKGSAFLLTSRIPVEHPSWDRAAVEARQSAMAKLALSAWPR